MDWGHNRLIAFIRAVMMMIVLINFTLPLHLKSALNTLLRLTLCRNKFLLRNHNSYLLLSKEHLPLFTDNFTAINFPCVWFSFVSFDFASHYIGLRDTGNLPWPIYRIGTSSRIAKPFHRLHWLPLKKKKRYFRE